MDGMVYSVGFAAKGEPLAYVLTTVKEAIQKILDKFPERKDHKLFISGKGNFREAIATIKPYKGNRDPSKKPEYYDEIKQYMVDHQGAIVVDGQEADDALAQAQWEAKDKSTCIVSVDKDLWTVPGWHMNPKKQVLEYITLADANYNFYVQMLVGDTVDNIPGIDQIGPIKAAKLLLPAKGDTFKMRELVMNEYKKQYGITAGSAYDEVSNLLYIRRIKDQRCPM